MQELAFLVWLDHARQLYNAALQERRDAWRHLNRRVSFNDQTKSLTVIRSEDPEAEAIPIQIQRDALHRVDNAFRHFFRRVKAGDRKPGFPRFQKEGRFTSFTFSIPAARSWVRPGCVFVPKLGEVKFHEYRSLSGKVLTVTVRCDAAGAWWVSFACDLGASPAKVEPRSIVGIDMGLKALAVTSDGEVIENPRHAARAAAKLARIQRTLTRRKRGSRGRERARIALARAHEHVRNQRLDHARKVAARLVGQYDVLAYEDLSIRAMSRGMLAKQMNDAGWRVLLHAIACKAEWAGKLVVAVDPRGTSQRCSGCGAMVPKALHVRVHDCPSCGLVMDRDENAAINIRALGRSAVSEAGAFAPPQARSDARKRGRATDGASPLAAPAS